MFSYLYNAVKPGECLQVELRILHTDAEDLVVTRRRERPAAILCGPWRIGVDNAGNLWA